MFGRALLGFPPAGGSTLDAVRPRFDQRVFVRLAQNSSCSQSRLLASRSLGATPKCAPNESKSTCFNLYGQVSRVPQGGGTSLLRKKDVGAHTRDTLSQTYSPNVMGVRGKG